MKKIAILMITILVAVFQSAYAKENMIYEIGLDKAPNNGAITLNLKSDYREKLKAVKENGNSVYFDIKNAKLADNLKADYNGDLSIVYQQIGSKVRIYLKGDNLQDIKAAFVAEKGLQPIDYNRVGLICVSISIVSLLALRCCSATIKLAKGKSSVKYPIKSAAHLNRQLCEFGKRRSPEIVLNSTNTIRQDVYVDFQYAKDRKNIKIAI